MLLLGAWTLSGCSLHRVIRACTDGRAWRWRPFRELAYVVSAKSSFKVKLDGGEYDLRALRPVLCSVGSYLGDAAWDVLFASCFPSSSQQHDTAGKSCAPMADLPASIATCIPEERICRLTCVDELNAVALSLLGENMRHALAQAARRRQTGGSPPSAGQGLLEGRSHRRSRYGERERIAMKCHWLAEAFMFRISDSTYFTVGV
jgi:hypothetical protein